MKVSIKEIPAEPTRESYFEPPTPFVEPLIIPEGPKSFLPYNLNSENFSPLWEDNYKLIIKLFQQGRKT